jgi:hypothetical protein
MKRVSLALAFLMCGAAGFATTLDYLSLDEMLVRSSAIVRGRVLGCEGFLRGPGIYTRSIQVLEQWKGAAAERMDVVLPGGTAAGRRQLVAGAPSLREGDEYVLFLWAGASGEMQILGMSQGVFALERDADGQERLVQGVPAEPAVDRSTGRLVTDRPIRLRVSELRSRTRTLGSPRRATQ